jgi:hypothetical protein
LTATQSPAAGLQSAASGAVLVTVAGISGGGGSNN